jgi:hypothetical protein
MDDDLKKLITKIYEEILQTSNKILRNCDLYTLEILQQEDPSYEVIANQLEQASTLIGIVSDAHPDDAEGFRTLVKANEYTQNIKNIAGAIRLGNEDLLKEYTEELKRRPFL